MKSTDAYKPISDYALIGNLRTAALIGRDGAIDWCCFPHLDRPSVFAALLDAKRGGRFRLSPAGGEMGEQQYVNDTNVLETRFFSEAGRLTVADFMPLSGNIHGCGQSEAPHEIHRILHCEGGSLEVEVEWSPRFDYARAATSIQMTEEGWLAAGDGQKMTFCGAADCRITDEGSGPVLRSRFRMAPGERKALVTRWGSEEWGCRLDASMEMMHRTKAVWEEWAHQEGLARAQEWAGEWLPLVIRSELLLKLLTHADTGAIAAAPTTSLPETIGGVRNWDYRYAWIRDASLTVQALISMGHKAEGIELLDWMERVSAARCEEEWNLQIMYGLHGEPELEEKELNHLDGYRGSRPVRIGNEAAEQFQLETYGELLNTGYELVRRGQAPESKIRDFLHRVADHLLGLWERPDHGIWEMRAGARHFTYSKMMSWVGLDRAILLSERFGLAGNRQWRTARKAIREQILEQGFDRDSGCFVLSYGSRELDAANLRIPLLEFLPADDPRVQGTIDRTMERLMENGLVYRYHADDGLPGKEGAFGICTFWLVDALALSNRVDEAWEVFTEIAKRANRVGLFPEQFDPATGEFLGNFPQAFTHIGFINSILYLAHAEGRPVPEPHPIGTPLHREVAVESSGRAPLEQESL
jgi:GH15 family glucan-1,4-alpha-glucosidase